MSYLTVCAIVKNERPYLIEWLEFHRHVGVDHFYIYDNGSTDGSRELVERYVAAGIATLRDWPHHPGQLEAYHDHLVRPAEDRWCAFIDVDEYLFSPTGEPLPEILTEFERFPAVVVNWCVFGTSGWQQRPDGLVVESYTRRSRSAGLNSHVKSIVDPAQMRPQRPGDPHHFIPLPGRYAVNELGVPVAGPFSDPPSFELLRLNHYWTKSVPEATAKALATERADNGGRRPLDAMLSDDLNEELDETIVSLAPYVRSRIASLELEGFFA